MPARPPRLKLRREFQRVAGKGQRAARPGLVLQALPAPGQPLRVGFTATKKIGNAVVRNRTRRRLKEAARLWLRENPVAGVDLVLIGREGTRTREFRKLQDDFRRALEKTGAVAKTPARADAA